jgi:hypothetical protein
VEPADEPLTGGSVSDVSRVGDTVRRGTGPWTPSVHAFLRHLEEVGYPYSPRVLGIDDSGREIVSFLNGNTMTRPWPAPLRGLEPLRSVGEALRQLEHAAAGFVPPPGAQWRTIPSAGAVSIRHGDVGPWNAVFDGDRLVGFIDWDFAEPAPPLWDLAQAAWYFVPLRPPELGWHPAGFPAEPDLRGRLAVLCSAYGADVVDVLDALVELQRVELGRTIELGVKGRWPWRHYLDRGDVEEMRSEDGWLAAHRASLR